MNKMRTFPIFMLLVLLTTSPVYAKPQNDLASLDSVLSIRDTFLKNKKRRIDSIKSRIPVNAPIMDKLKGYDRLYEEYLTLSFDSAMRYINLAEKLVSDTGDYDLNAKVRIHKSMSYATSGHFSQAIDELKKIQSSCLSDTLLEKYYQAYQWTYGLWAEYSQDKTFAPIYYRNSKTYLDSLIQVTPRNTSLYNYRIAEKALMFNHDFETAKKNYLKVVEKEPKNSRLYAQSAFALAQAYNNLQDRANYRKWLINAAISDQMIPLKENLALQDVALLIKNEDGDLERANAYLNYSLNDALEYNNRLRILEIGKKLPAIATAYQETVLVKNKQLHLYLATIVIIVIILIIAIAMIIEQKRKIRNRNVTLSTFNDQLKVFNKQLQETNRSREQYVNLFLNLCAGYIDKYNRLQLTVTSKVKAGQYNELQKLLQANSRPSEAELREVFFNFDTAFLRLYPDFIKNVNTLLQPDKAICPKSSELLNANLRILALIRMGITDSTKIATLLFYSQQTIFNRRTEMRNRAINRDSFEKEIMDICPIYPE
ncbi:hypothetical protein ED328_05265 [Muribaculaceae bacterium Isolate-001 (NCI)]|nr:hypothetical protein EEK90_01635 [Muribaculaceae bacterium Isolate-036 (Harlan)]RXE68938.1 hypothetical protein ED328_05265 [Muribaculaceae bacterium Isolate-001 (NCI)]GFI38523.1 hypothetical protein IMSAGC016_00286 [Muribaculaceae bacterium]